jgi:hypothetical protein
VDREKGNVMNKILLSVILLLGLQVNMHAEELRAKAQGLKTKVERRNNYVFDETYGYAIPAGDYCRKYVDIIKEKDKQIKALKQEIASFQGEEQQRLQKHLKRKYDQEMKEIDEKRSSKVKKDTTNSIIISDKPTP